MYLNIIVNTICILLVIANIFFVDILRIESLNILQIEFFAIGQGDSYLVTTPDGLNLLVDAGRDAAVLEKLESSIPWYQNLDYMLLTHPDGDHVGKMADIWTKWEPTTIFYNQIEHDNPEYLRLKEIVETSGLETKRKGLAAGEVWKLGCCVEFIIYTPRQIDLTQDDHNDSSISFLLRYGEFEMWAGGDLSIEIEERIAPLVGQDLEGRLDALKVSHHGSASSTSSRFLESILPKIAIVQSGQGNSYGHPAPEVLGNLQSVETEVYRNDLHGDITLQTDGQHLILHKEY